MNKSEQLSRADVAQMIDQTLLKPESTTQEVNQFIAQARNLGVYSVCVSPTFVSLSVPAGLKMGSVVGFPSGTSEAKVKAFEAMLLADKGADELDMVINLGYVKEGRWDLVEEEIRAVREAVPGVLLKVIIEAALLDDDEIIAACRAAEGAGADFVKTSTGFHPSGGATPEDVALMSRAVGSRLGVKASGGIRSAKTAAELIDAGATRLGTSSAEVILAEWGN